MLEGVLSEKAWADPTTTDRVAENHRALSERTRSFSVPTIVLDAGKGRRSSGRW
jgi:hypothetical protein